LLQEVPHDETRILSRSRVNFRVMRNVADLISRANFRLGEYINFIQCKTKIKFSRLKGEKIEVERIWCNI